MLTDSDVLFFFSPLCHIVLTITCLSVELLSTNTFTVCYIWLSKLQEIGCFYSVSIGILKGYNKCSHKCCICSCYNIPTIQCICEVIC